MILITKTSDQTRQRGVCVCFFSHSFWTSSSLDVPAGVTQEEGHTHRISHPPSFCGACLNFSREKDSAIPFRRRL